MSERSEPKIKVAASYQEWTITDSWPQRDFSRNSYAEGGGKTFTPSSVRSDDWSPSILGVGESKLMSPETFKKHVRKELPAYTWLGSMGTLAIAFAMFWR